MKEQVGKLPHNKEKLKKLPQDNKEELKKLPQDNKEHHKEELTEAAGREAHLKHLEHAEGLDKVNQL
jgi:hypothetical protein